MCNNLILDIRVRTVMGKKIAVLYPPIGAIIVLSLQISRT